MKKLLAIVLALTLCLGATSALAATTLKLGIYPADTEPDAIATHEDYYIPAFEATHPDVVIDRANYEYALDTFVPMAEAGQTPTIFQPWFTEPQKLIAGGFVRDVTDLLEARGWLDKMNPSIRELLTKDGRVYGMPRDAYALGVVANAELFREAGLVDENDVVIAPKTWTELIEASVKIKEETGAAGLCLLAQDNAGGWHFSNIAWTFGAILESQDADGKWTANLNSAEVKAAMEMVRDMKWKYDILTSDPTSENWGTGWTNVATGSAAMYIGANDGVSQLASNGLATESTLIFGIPAGTEAHSLSGGTCYMFAANATDDEVNAALDYLEVMGKAPVLNDAVIAGLKADAQYRVDNGIAVIRDFPVWSDAELAAQKQAVLDEYANVDPAQVAGYFDAVSAPNNLKLEEPAATQDMYAELTKVLQAVLTDADADIQALLDIAQANFQDILDASINK